MKRYFFKNCPYANSYSCDTCPNRIACLNRLCQKAQTEKRELVCCEHCVNRNSCKAKFAKSNRKQIVASAMSMNRALKSKRLHSQAATAVKSTAVMRRPQWAYAYAVVYTLVSKITFKSIIKWTAFLLAGLMLLQLGIQAIVDIVYDIEGKNNVVVTFAEPSEMDTSEFLQMDTNMGMEEVSFPEVIINGAAPEETTYNPDEVFTATAEGPRPYDIYYFTYDQKVLIAKMVWREARGECYEGKVAVAAVAINRWLKQSREFGLSIEEVITHPGAFGNVSRVTMANLESVPECLEAVNDACRGWDPTREVFEDGALFFYAHNSSDLSAEARAAREGILSMVIGNHTFHDRLN